MLVLSRKAHEQIQIRDDIVIEVISIGHNRVKLAISAPADVSIRRSEIPTPMELELEPDGSLDTIRHLATNPR